MGEVPLYFDLRATSRRVFSITSDPCTFWAIRGFTEPQQAVYEDTLLIRQHLHIGPSIGLMPRASWGSQGGGCFLVGEVPL